MSDIGQVANALMEANEKATEHAKLWAKSYHQERIFKQLKEDFLASLKMEMRTKIGKISDVELETRVRAGQAWKDFVSVQIEELKQAGIARIKYENALREVEVLRTMLSLKKEEIKRFQ